MTHVLHTFVTTLRSSTPDVHLDKVTVDQDALWLQLTATAPQARCPCWAVSSSAIHRRDRRQLIDLPGGVRLVRLRLTVRKFVCRHPSWARRVFTARLPTLVAPSARQTARLRTAWRAIGLALGGNAGARLAAHLRLPTRPATLLRLVRAAPMPRTSALQAVGVDEWAWRRGHRDGTIVVDLATHRVVGLLPDRSATTVATWLAQHPTIRVVCRDRRDLYADGMRRGAPEAVHVVDRCHLVQHLRQVLEAFLIDHRPVLQAAAVGTALARTPPTGLTPMTPLYRGRRQSPNPTPPPAERPPRHARWVAIDEAVRMLRARGTPIAIVARQLGSSRPTVSASLRRDVPPGPRQRQRPPSARVLTPSIPYLIRRWRESGAASRQRWREMQARGDTHSARTVGRCITRLRRAADAGHPPEAHRAPSTRPQGPSARAVSWVMVGRAAKRSAEAQTSLDQRCQMDAHSTHAYRLTHALLAVVRGRRGRDLEAWITAATDRDIDALARFARGLQEDLAAITAGLTLAWSNGVTEGQIHRLTLVKRQGDGRAGFARLRQRVLHAA